MKWVQIVSCVLLGVVSLSSHAGNLTPPHQLEYTTMLPGGVRNPRFKTMVVYMDSKFDAHGFENPLAMPLNKNVKWTDVLTKLEKTDGKALVTQFKGLLQTAGVDVSGGPGSTTADLNISANVMLPVMAVGVSDKFSLALAVPVYSVDIQAKTGFVANDSAKAALRELHASNPVKGAKLQQNLNNALNGKITSVEYGYEPIESESFTRVGDMRLVGKYELFRQTGGLKRNSVILRPMVTFPTGYEQNVDKLVDAPTGDGQFDIGTQVSWDHNAGSWFRINAFAGYTVQLPDQIEMRIPEASGSPLAPAADKELVDRDLGDQVEVGTSLNFGSLSKGFSLGVGYHYQYQMASSFKGSRFSNTRYTYLDDLNPFQDLHSVTAMLGFATVDYYKSGGFAVPLQLFVTYSHPVEGRNTVSNPLIATELVMFF